MVTTASGSEIKLGIPDKMMMLRGLFNPTYFNKSVRPLLLKKTNNEPEIIQELIIETLSQNELPISILSKLVNKPEELNIQINGQKLIPFGTAAGLDKNGDMMNVLSHFFGFLEPGTVIVNPREGNPKPRVVALEDELDIYNAQGFPSKGLDYFMKKLIEYKKQKGNVPVYVDICGLPISEDNAVKVAMDEMKVLLQKIEPYADGFVWDPASPNTAALSMLKTPELFHETAALMKQSAPNKLLLVKMWPYEPEEKTTFLNFIKSFIEGGGHGAVTTNTKMFPKEQIPRQDWGYKSAGRSGKFLKPYRLRSVKDIRAEFPEAIIVATGGIYDGDDAYDTFKAGANMLEGYTPYVFYGLGLLNEIENTVAKNLKKDGYKNLQELQDAVKGKK